MAKNWQPEFKFKNYIFKETTDVMLSDPLFKEKYPYFSGWHLFSDHFCVNVTCRFMLPESMKQNPQNLTPALDFFTTILSSLIW